MNSIIYKFLYISFPLISLFSCASNDRVLKEIYWPCMDKLNIAYKDRLTLYDENGKFFARSDSPKIRALAGIDVTGVPFVQIKEAKKISDKTKVRENIIRIIIQDGRCKIVKGG
ncbi:MAG: hypothetical protein H6622_10485 [Halobacteriovoraceae bacterium]|nr:hypothetical protein [Halobacteriovoraceae bacterium]